MTFSLYRALLLVLGATSSLASILPRQNVECNEVNGGLGNFVVYNAAISETVGCLDENARWVVDGSCGVFNATAGYTGPDGGLTYDYLQTPAGWCEFQTEPGHLHGYIFYCGPGIVNDDNGSIPLFTCPAYGGLYQGEGHYPWSFRALEQPVGSQKVNVTFELTSTATGLDLILSFKFPPS